MKRVDPQEEFEKMGPAHFPDLGAGGRSRTWCTTRFSDPARFSFALGGKDCHPFPVPLKTYDESLAILRCILNAAKLGDTEKIDGFKRLDRMVRAVEQRRQL